MNKSNLKVTGAAISSELWRFLIIFMLVITVEARLRENNAELVVSCDDSAMQVRMTFKYPFRGIVFIPEHYYDPTCSYGISPNSTVSEVTLTLPHDSCKMRIMNSSKKLIGFNTIVVFHHRMLETVYDYTQNVTCELKYPIKDLNKNVWREPVLKTWISFENPASVLPENYVEKMGLEDALLLVYHVRDRGVHRDMMVMNCIGHDASTVNEKTRFYQLSNPFGCSSESDLLSNFTVFRNPIGSADMMAYATIRNFSMVVRRRLYITCGAQICRDKCERKCENLRRSLYFSDIVTKGLVNRLEGSKIPASLTAFERFYRQRRSYAELFPHDVANEQSEFLFEEMNETSTYFSINVTIQTSEMSQNDTSPNSPDVEHIRSKRAIEPLKTEKASSKLNIIVLRSDETVDLVQSTFKVQFTTKSDAESSVSKNFSGLCETDSVVKVKVTFESQHSSKIDRGDMPEKFNFNSFLRAMVAIFALICISGVCYSLFSFRRQSGAVSVPSYVSESYI